MRPDRHGARRYAPPPLQKTSIRFLTLAPALSFAFASLGFAACSSKDSPPAATPGNDAATIDASTGGDDDASPDTSDPGQPADSCGTAPFVTLGIQVNGTGGSGDVPLPGAKFTTPLCPSSYKIADDAGKLTGSISKGVPFYGRFEAKNYVNLLTPEQIYEADDDTVTVSLPASLFSALIPGYDASKPTVFIGGFKDGGHGACDALDGIKYTVTGHPEVTITYYTPAAIPNPTTDDFTSSSGRASIIGLALGEPVTLVASKPGCEVVFKHGANTGRAPLEANYITFIGAYVHDLPGADAGTSSDAAPSDANSE